MSEEVLEKLSIFKDYWPMLKNNLRIRERKEKVLHEISHDLLGEVRRIKEEAIERLEDNIERLRRVLESRGAELRIARDGLEASRMVVDLCKQYNVKLVVKSKSLTTEEIKLNKFLESEGIEVVETDLGERIVQLAGHRPSHILGPAFHMTRYEVAQVLTRYYGRPIPPDPQEIVMEVRREFREKYLRAGMAITGANFIVAENGAVVLVTNEGNDRLSIAFTPIHVIIAGVEKILPTTKDVFKILKVLSRNATGQRLSSYTSFHIPTSISYPREGSVKPRKMIYILIDNGRIEAARDRDVKEALYCIRCASCLQVCPPYNIVGGHVFGYIYSGPMGIPWTMITHGVKNTEFAQLCNFCGLCKEACPVNIDLPYLNSITKERYGKKFGYPSINKNLKRYESFITLAANIPSLSNYFLSSKIGRKLIEMFIGLDSRRTLPKFSKNNLGEVFKEVGDGREGKVALFTDALVYYMYPEWGLKASEILSRLGFRVVLPKQKSSGMPLIQYGFIDEARKIARYNVESLYDLVEKGYKVVSVEPTAHYCLTYYYPKLLDTEISKNVAENSFGFFEFLKYIGLSKVTKILKSLDDMKITYHLPCHSRSRDGSMATKEFLESLGAKVFTKNVGCCGLAGTWGMKKGGHGYELSIEIGRIVVKQYEEMDGELIATESSICLQQLASLSKLPCNHVFDIVEISSD
ncbi:MAG: LUD domain-containing protein [Nitrososphaeria archaeon]|nr:LUD domain-containing protein [Nitrososphaeria archaeon]